MQQKATRWQSCAAQDLIKAGKYKDALAKVRDADAVGGKNANESYLVERMRLAAASGHHSRLILR